MKIILTSLLGLIFPFVISFTCFAEVGSDSLNITPDQWEPHSEGIALAHSLITQAGKEGKESFVIIFIKNTSTTTKECVVDSIGSGFKCFTLDGGGKWQPLRNVEEHVILRASSVAIKPGQTYAYPLALSTDELALLKSRSVKFRILLFDETTKQKIIIESLPANLTETIVPKSDK
jgi:hypothetical protein